MPEAVRQLVDNYWPRLEAEIGRFLADRSSPQRARTLVGAIRSQWGRIPREEKQIPYLDNEVEFWFALHSLDQLTRAPLDTCVTAIREDLEHSLRVSHEVLRRHTKLPPGLNARRPLP